MGRTDFAYVAVFRALLIMATALVGITVAWDYVWTSDLSAVRIAMGWRGQGSLFDDRLVGFMHVAVPAASVATYVGMFFFSPSARYALGFLLVFGILWAALDGLHVAFAIGVLAPAALGLIDGALLTMSFLPPVADRFDRRQR